MMVPVLSVLEAFAPIEMVTVPLLVPLAVEPAAPEPAATLSHDVLLCAVQGQPLEVEMVTRGLCAAEPRLKAVGETV